MADKESYQDRQESELQVLKSIFDKDVTDLRPQQEKWIPLEIKIDLAPAQDSKINPAFCSVTLHIVCPKNYPKTMPKIFLKNAKGLNEAKLANLLVQLNKEAYSLKGEVMIFELCQSVQNFLHGNNQPPETTESFYDTMLKNRQLQDQQKQDESNKKEKKLQEQLQSDILKRREQLMKNNRMRRNTIGESSPRHLSSSNSEDRNINEVCEEHRSSKTFYIPVSGRKIQTSSCLGHSQKGCINYSGIDLGSGKLLFITEWNLENIQLEAKNISVDEFVETIEKKIADLSRLRHKNLICYEGVLCVKKKDHLQIFLFQEFLLGISIFTISERLGWCPEGASMVAKGVLEALIYLHNNGVSHGKLLDVSVFMDNTGNIRVSDFSIINFIQEIVNDEQPSNDLPALGTLVESLIPTPPHVEMRDFINRCKSDRTLSGSDLLDLPFLNTTIASQYTPPVENFKAALKLPEFVQPAVPFLSAPLVSSDVSRIREDFEIDSFIGKGAFGDVLKVRNKLDNRQYAIKRIPLNSRNKFLFKKMTREVELLSKMNHENVVRYFNSWIEIETMPLMEEDELEESDSSFTRKKSNKMVKTCSQTHLAINDESSDDDSFSPGWNNYIGNSGQNISDSDDGIEFADSKGECPVYDEQSSSDDAKDLTAIKSEPKVRSVLYIQMEFCEKSTIRTAIDECLFKEKERLWKLFREIVEGLSHIHQQGIIHRDLKPVNIFLDSKDRVKIGDFGLATTSFLVLQNEQVDQNTTQLNFGDSQTGQVGTALYVAPELSGKASKSNYNQKVDLYSLGIIFFEMCTPPLTTGMERIKKISAIRQVDINLPEEMLSDPELKTEVMLLKWLLDHQHENRPTCEELLQSKLLPPPKMDTIELQDIVRNVLSNPSTSQYKHLISKCLQQESDAVTCVTYDTGMVSFNPVFENVKSKIVQILKKHGAYDISTPLLTPHTSSGPSETAVRLMTHSGSVVLLPSELRQPFLRHVVVNNNCFFRRYSVGRVYREKKIHYAHPKQSFECAFDIVSPHRGHFLVDAELLAVVNEIVFQFDVLMQKNISIRINHTSLLRAIFLHYQVPKDKHRSLIGIINDFLEGRITKLSAREAIKILLPNKEQLRDVLLMTESSLTHASSTFLKTLRDGRGEASALAKGAIRELDAVISLSQQLGVSLPINLCVGLSKGYDCMRSGSILWQLMAEFKVGKSQTVLACGGRYDNSIEDYQKMAKRNLQGFVGREMYCAGFSLAIDKIVFCLSMKNEHHCREIAASVDLMVYVVGSRPPLKEVTNILKSVWTAGIKCSFIEVESSTAKDDELWANSCGANHIILVGEDGSLKVKSWQTDHFFEKSVTLTEMMDFIRSMNIEVSSVIDNIHQNISIARNNSNTNMSSKSFDATVAGSKTIDCIFLTVDKFNLNKRKRIENQIEQKLGNVIQKFNKKETFTIFAVELDSKTIKALIACIDPNPADQSQTELDMLLERNAKFKQKYLQEIYDEITDRLARNKNKSIIGIFSVIDSYNRLIL